jgi:hypothetical protein
MDKNILKSWIDNNFDYQTALSLFDKYGKNKALSRFLSGKPNNHKTQKLKYELMKSVGSIPESELFATEESHILQGKVETGSGS